jgi:hypothetical protein
MYPIRGAPGVAGAWTAGASESMAGSNAIDVVMSAVFMAVSDSC